MGNTNSAMLENIVQSSNCRFATPQTTTTSQLAPEPYSWRI